MPHKISRTTKVTLKDIADALGISKATVSLALNDNHSVAESTRQLVLQKSMELGYVYNRAAAGLSTGKTYTIGLAVHDFTNPYFARVCASVEAVLRLSGRMSFLCNTDESLQRQTRFIHELCEHNADGLILCPAIGTKAEHLQAAFDQALPLVLIARDVVDVDLDFVGNDDEQALMLATTHIISLGHQRIAMLGGTKTTTVGDKRRRGFLKAMRDHQREWVPEWLVDCQPTIADGEKATRAIMALAKPPTALVCFNDLIALGALSVLHELGLQPGKDIAIIGCDGIDESSRAYARLSTVNVQKTAMGQSAAALLLQRMDTSDITPQRIMKAPALIIRGSCGAIPPK